MSAPKVDAITVRWDAPTATYRVDRTEWDGGKVVMYDDVAELIEAAGDYYHGYCVDEAGDDGVEWTGCTEEQHQKAKRLKLALARIGSAS